MRVRRTRVTALVVLIALLAVLIPAVGFQGKLPATHPAELTFDSPVQFGQQTLPPGTYQFRCVHRGTYHLMTVYRVSPDPSGRAVALGKPVATDYCRMEPLSAKVKTTSVLTTKDTPGDTIVSGVRIQGEQVLHIFGEALEIDSNDN